LHAKCVARTNQNSVLHKEKQVANQVQKAFAQWGPLVEQQKLRGNFQVLLDGGSF